MDMVGGVSMKEVIDEATGMANRVITDPRQQAKGADLRPRIVLHDEKETL